MTPLEMLARLIAFPTISSDSNLDLTDFVRGWLAEHGVTAKVIPDAAGRKASLFATIGPQVPGGVVLSGHSDVVPVPGQWSGDPFRLREVGSRLIGRGVTDMKGFVAAALVMVPEWQKMGLRRPIHIALSRDEEIGCIGADELAQAMAAVIAPPAGVIVGEPSMMAVIDGHKGSFSFRTKVTGRAGHSSRMDIGVSAVMNAGAVVSLITDMLHENMDNPQSGDFVPPYTTLHCGLIQGGTAANIVADSCEFVTDFRIMPGDSPEVYLARIDELIGQKLLPRMQRVAPEAGFERIPRSNVPPLRPDPEGAAAHIALAAGAAGHGGQVSYATEAGFFQRLGWSTVVCGPGDIAQAHTIDEFLEVAQFDAAVDFMRRLGQSFGA